MSLEVAIQENTTAINKLIEALQADQALRAQVLAKTEEVVAQQNAPKPRAKKTDAAEAAAVSPPPPPAAEAAPPPPAGLTVEEVQKQFGAWLSAVEGDAREERKTWVKALLQEVGAAKVGEIEPDQRARALDLLNQKIAGKAVNFGADPDDDLM